MKDSRELETEILTDLNHKLATMKLTLPFLLLTTTTAFAPSPISRPASSLSVAANPTTSLIPPSKIDASSVANLFESRVQKTYGRYPITFVEGKGCWLTDEEGKKYLGEYGSCVEE